MEAAALVQQDHDNIITLIANVKTLTEEVRLMRDSTKDDIKALQANKLDRTEFLEYKVGVAVERKEKIADFEKSEKGLQTQLDAQAKQLSMLIRAYFIGLGVLGTIEFVMPFVLKHFGII